MIKITEKIQIPNEELEVSYSRSSGPGGQNVNKVSSKATVRWNFAVNTNLPSDARTRFQERFASRLTSEGILIINRDQFRDRERNLEACFEQIRAMILEILTPPKKRKPTQPSKRAVQARLTQKRQQSEKKSLRRQKPDY